MASGGLGKVGAASITSMPNQASNAGSQITIPVIKPSQISYAPNSQFSNLGQNLMNHNNSPEKSMKKAEASNE